MILPLEFYMHFIRIIIVKSLPRVIKRNLKTYNRDNSYIYTRTNKSLVNDVTTLKQQLQIQ